MNFKIVYVCDIDEDIDDKIAVEYLFRQKLLHCVVLDRPSNSSRIKELKELGVIFEEDIPLNSDYIFCGGALTKVSQYLKSTNTKVKLFVCNGGFAGSNIVDDKNQLEKFKNKTHIRTYNFNCDVISAKDVLSSNKIEKILLVSKNVCHDTRNTYGKFHKDEFLGNYKLRENKCLHDLLMVKEGISYINNTNMVCGYMNVDCEHKSIQPYERKISYDGWGSIPNPNSHIKISIGIKNFN